MRRSPEWSSVPGKLYGTPHHELTCGPCYGHLDRVGRYWTGAGAGTSPTVPFLRVVPPNRSSTGFKCTNGLSRDHLPLIDSGAATAHAGFALSGILLSGIPVASRLNCWAHRTASEAFFRLGKEKPHPSPHLSRAKGPSLL